MNARMQQSHGRGRTFLFVLLLVWAASCIAGYVYAQQQNIPARLFLAALPAFLVEIGFYVALGSDSIRAGLERTPRAIVGLGLAASALSPYCLYSVSVGNFRWSSFAALAALAGAASFWYVVLPHVAMADVLFLIGLSAVLLTKVFGHIYAGLSPKLYPEYLGHLMWIRVAAVAFLCQRRVQGIGFGFLPSRTDWAVGIEFYVLFLPVGAFFGYWLRVIRYHPPAFIWWKVAVLAIATFIGILWVVALSEEFVFRGLLQQWLSTWLRSKTAGLVLASILFGSVHVWYGRPFPNWRFAIVAAAAGIFYGLAFRTAGSIRAAMVTHALSVTTWRIFFS